MNHASVLDYGNIIVQVATETAKLNKKTCSKCGADKWLYEFYRSKKGKLGRESQCKSCHKKYIQANKDNVNERRRHYFQANKDRINERQRLYFQVNKERLDKLRAKHYQEYKDSMRERSRDKVANLDDDYIKRLFVDKSSLKFKDIPQELIECKREHLRLKRELKNHK